MCPQPAPCAITFVSSPGRGNLSQRHLLQRDRAQHILTAGSLRFANPSIPFPALNVSPHSSHLHGIWIAGLGVVVLSFDALLVRLAAAPAWDVVFWRGWLMFASLFAVLVLRGKGNPLPGTRELRLAAVAVAFFMAINTVFFVLSVMLTRVANTVVIFAIAPFFAALFSRLFLKESLPLRTWVAITVSTLGVVVVFAGSVGHGNLVGDLLALLIALSVGASLTLLRRYHELQRIPLIGLGGAIAGLAAWPFADPFALETTSYVTLAVMGLVQMPLALVLITTATRHLPAPEVSLFLLIETVLGPLWVWWAIGEQPPELTIVGGVGILGAIAVNSALALRQIKQPKPGVETSGI